MGIKLNLLKLRLLAVSSLFACLFFVVPRVSLAVETCPNGYEAVAGVCVPSAQGGGITGSQDLTGVLVQVITILLSLAGIVAVLSLIIGGYWYITSAGNEEIAEKGKKTLINSIIGVAVIVASYLIVKVISGLFTK